MRIGVPLHLRRFLPHVSLATLEALAWGELGGSRTRSTLHHMQVCRACHGRLRWVRALPAALEGATRLAPLQDATSVLERRARGERVILPVPQRDAVIDRTNDLVAGRRPPCR
jgi:hypothetical protein